MVDASDVINSSFIDIFHVLSKETLGNKYLVIGRNAQKIIIVGFMKQHIQTESVLRICAVLFIFAPTYNMTGLQKRRVVEACDAAFITV